MIRYARTENLLRPVLGIAMPRSPQTYASGFIVQAVARCNNQEFRFRIKVPAGIATLHPGISDIWLQFKSEKNIDAVIPNYFRWFHNRDFRIALILDKFSKDDYPLIRGR